ELTGRAVEHIEHAIAVRPHHYFAGAAVQFDVGENGNLGRIPIEFVVRRELVMPFELAGVGIDGDDGGAIEVVSKAVVAVIVGTRVASAPHREVRLGIIGTGNPDGGSAVQVRVV